MVFSSNLRYGYEPGQLMMSGAEDGARTAVQAETTALIIPGVFVAALAGQSENLERRGIILPAAADSIILGVSLAYFPPIRFENGYPPGSQIAYYWKGQVGIWVITDVKAQDPVFAFFNPTNPLQKGYAGNTAGATAVAVPNARFLSSTPGSPATPGVALVSLALP
jgi:hypothetical protein